MLMNEIKPGINLAEYVRLYRIIDFRFPVEVAIPPKMYTPRPEQCLQFYPRDTESVLYPGSNEKINRLRAVITGQHTIVNNRFIGNDFLSFQVVFQPGALYRLCGIDMKELTNQYLDAEIIFGSVIREVNEQLFAAGNYTQMIVAVETFLITLIKNNKRTSHPVDHSGFFMLQQPSEKSMVDIFLKESFLCHRQYDRKFLERFGVPPKQFLQIIRFDRAFRMKNRYPEKDWLTIALHCGYHDYQHLSKEYKQYTGYTPARFFELDQAAPERALGYSET